MHATRRLQRQSGTVTVNDPDAFARLTYLSTCAKQRIKLAAYIGLRCALSCVCSFIFILIAHKYSDCNFMAYAYLLQVKFIQKNTIRN